MTIERIVRCFQHHHPANEVDAMITCNVGLRHIDSGSFRNVYRVDDLPLVAKFPYDEGDGHSRREFRIIRRLKRGKKLYANLQEYIPDVYYMHDRTGVMLMKHYPLAMKAARRKLNKHLGEIGAAFSEAFGISDWDFHSWNFGTNEDGGLVLLDFGCLEQSN